MPKLTKATETMIFVEFLIYVAAHHNIEQVSQSYRLIFLDVPPKNGRILKTSSRAKLDDTRTS